jgi:hypothetical protein
MVLATCPLILWLLDGTVAGFASALLVITLFATGLTCLSLGQKNHIAYDAVEVAERPRIPWKLIGSVLIALVIALLAAAKIDLGGIPLLFGCATFILCLVAFGLDPMRDKGMDNPAIRMRLANQKRYHHFDQRCEQMMIELSALDDDELCERVRMLVDTVMGLVSTIDFETPLLKQIAPALSKMLAKMEAETAALVDAANGDLSPFMRRKFLIKMQALADTFEARARRTGIAQGRDSFELQTHLLFDRMNRSRTG